MYVIVRTSDGKYVTPPGQEHSYSKRLEDARRFSSREAAERELCPENERVVPLASLLQPIQDR